VSLAPLELICFGPPTARVGGGPPPPEVLWRKHLALLAFLALGPEHGRAREQLLGAFWPEKPESQARHSLNEALRRLRVALGADRLRSARDTVQLATEGLAVDALTFAATVDRDPAAALALVRGEFLEGLALADAPAFEEWAMGERARVRDRCVGAALALGERAHAAGRAAEAVGWGQRAVAAAPLAERPVRLVMRAAALAGDPAAALAAYHAFADRLARELKERPGRELADLAERVRGGRWRSAGGAPALDEPPLVGGGVAAGARVATVVLDGLTTGPRAAIVVGGPGAGKTRVLGEGLRAAALEGATVVHTRPLASDHDAPWSTLRALVRAGLLEVAGARAADPGAVAALQRDTPGDVGAAAAALSDVLAAAADERPVVVAVDDLQYADGATLAALAGAFTGMASGPVVLAGATCPPDPDAPRELLALLGAVGADLRGCVVQLEPLDLPAVRALVSAMAGWCVDEAARDRLARRVHADSGGNALFAVTLLRALATAVDLRADYAAWPAAHQTLESPPPFTMPNVVRMAVLARLATVPERARDVLRAAATVGLAVDAPLTATVCGLPPEAVAAELPALERAGLLTLDGDRWVFPAALVAEVAHAEGLTAGQRRVWRDRAIEALAARSDLEARARRAELLARARPGEEAFAAAVELCEAAVAARSPRTARRALAAAERALPEPGAAQRAVLERLRSDVAAG
jgi:DNA-binding SARP family transcriptional activator